MVVIHRSSLLFPSTALTLMVAKAGRPAIGVDVQPVAEGRATETTVRTLSMTVSVTPEGVSTKPCSAVVGVGVKTGLKVPPPSMNSSKRAAMSEPAGQVVPRVVQSVRRRTKTHSRQTVGEASSGTSIRLNRPFHDTKVRSVKKVGVW